MQQVRESTFLSFWMLFIVKLILDMSIVWTQYKLNMMSLITNQYTYFPLLCSILIWKLNVCLFVCVQFGGSLLLLPFGRLLLTVEESFRCSAMVNCSELIIPAASSSRSLVKQNLPSVLGCFIVYCLGSLSPLAKRFLNALLLNFIFVVNYICPHIT